MLRLNLARCKSLTPPCIVHKEAAFVSRLVHRARVLPPWVHVAGEALRLCGVPDPRYFGVLQNDVCAGGIMRVALLTTLRW